MASPTAFPTVSGPLGALVSAGSLAADTAQSALKGAKIIAKAINRGIVEPRRMVRWVYHNFHFDHLSNVNVIDEVTDGLRARDAAKAEDAAENTRAHRRLVTEGNFDHDMAAPLKHVLRNTDASVEDLRAIERNLGEFRRLDEGPQRSLARQIVRASDDTAEAARHLDDLDRQTLEAVREAGRIDEAVAVVRQTDDGAAVLNDLRRAQTVRLLRADDPIRLVSEFEPQHLRKVLREDAVRLVNRVGVDTTKVALQANRFDEMATLVKSAEGASDVLNDLRRLGDDSLARFLRLDESIQQANGLDEVAQNAGKTPGELADDMAHQTRLAAVRASQSDVDGVAMRTETINRLARSIDDMAEADVDNFARHLNDKIAKNADNLRPNRLDDSPRPQNLFNPVKGGTFEIIAGKEVFGVGEVTAIGAKAGGFEADLVLRNGKVVELKSAGVGSSTDIATDLENIKNYQRQADNVDDSQEVIYVSNNPRELYRKGEVGSEFRAKVISASDSVDFRVTFGSAAELAENRKPTEIIIREFT